ncbi:hypothetical protein P4K49_16280 [Bacillus cereus]|uniref:hypothetical protein n=1 Tax=Bacillus thuringiensis TaxID=1428 RepID=UPI0006818B4E|nr:hypothetical protein [Bacillus thuringiensis]MEB8879984.1 hypothetical protein [Bacillus cereus]MBG9644301.1 hypothetical protein [Bacillus thuringiensis]MBG9649605.1 hypothetical protein [Bacillus thuringiensis]MEB9617799.1 hypothetical protein [Bacillus cereus]MEB9643454.1 hypothetical protein [Bacillus cereus]
MVGKVILWTKEEIAYLEDSWGTYSIKSIAKKLDRTVNAIKLKANRIGLSDPRLHFNGLTVLQLADVLQINYKTIESWYERFAFPVRLKLFAKTQKIKVVYYKDFWNWLKRHKQVVDFSKVEYGILGPEPEWMKDKRDADVYRRKKERNPWTKQDELLLRSMVKANCYTYLYIAKRLQRTESAIKKKLEELGILERPVESQASYTEDEIRISLELFEKGYTVDAIAERFGKSALTLVGYLKSKGYRFRAKMVIKPENPVF